MDNRFIPTTCPHDCPSACSLEVEKIDDNTIGKVRGAKSNSYTLGTICSKVSRYAQRTHHPDRLSHPMKRVGPKGSGEFVRISWDEALDEVADRFKGISDEFGSEAIWPYYYAGTMGQLQRDGINRLRHAMGYSNQGKTICTTLAYEGWTAGTGAIRGADPREMSESDLIILWGCNAVATQVNVMTQAARAKRGRQAPLVVVDPYLTPTAQKADMHLMLRPGTDGALACAVMHQLFEEGLADWDYLDRFTDHPRALHQHLQDKTPQWAAAITGLEAGQIKAFARLYGETQRSFIRLGIGFSRSRNGAHNVHAVSCLPAVSGAWQYPGGGALLGTSGLFRLDKRLIEGTEMIKPGIRTLDMSRIGPVLCNDPRDIAGGPPVKGMLIQNTNPMVVAPELNRVHRGMSREDLFVCVHEQFMTETAKMADILLPATTFVEHNDIYQSYGQTHLQLGMQIIEPYAECRSNHQVICELAHRLGAEHAGFEMSEREIIDQTLSESGYPDIEALGRERWLDCALPFEQMHFMDGFNWPDKKFRFKPHWPEQSAMPGLPDHWDVIDKASEERPFRLITPPARTFLNSSFTESTHSREREQHPRAIISPADADGLGISDGALVRIGNHQGEVRLHTEINSGISAGTVAVEGIWPGTAYVDGVGVNALVSADSPAPAGGAVFHDTAVWIRAS